MIEPMLRDNLIAAGAIVAGIALTFVAVWILSQPLAAETRWVVRAVASGVCVAGLMWLGWYLLGPVR